MDAGVAQALLVTVGFVCVVPIYLMMAAWAEGSVDAAGACGVACGSVFLFLLAWMTRDSAIMLVFAAMLLALCIGVPLYYRRQGKQLHQEIDDEEITKCLAALHRDSRNSGAHAMLGEAYFKKQRFTEAVAHFEAALTISPDPETNSRVAKWTRKLEEARTAKVEWETKQATRSR